MADPNLPTVLHRLAVTVAVVTMSLLAPVPATALDAERPPWMDGHIAVPNPATLDPAAAQGIYDDLMDDMAARYRISRVPAADDYLEWNRFNTAPYLSATHGQRYVNNYANVQEYGAFGQTVPMPVGTVAVKDTFTVTDDGSAYPGPLMVMEKMAPGFDPDGGDWRYTMILPDGSVFGTTGGDRAENVASCKGCHEGVADQDFLYFMPEAYRP